MNMPLALPHASAGNNFPSSPSFALRHVTERNCLASDKSNYLPFNPLNHSYRHIGKSKRTKGLIATRDKTIGNRPGLNRVVPLLVRCNSSRLQSFDGHPKRHDGNRWHGIEGLCLRKWLNMVPIRRWTIFKFKFYFKFFDKMLRLRDKSEKRN
jgi:hypothetical protein